MEFTARERAHERLATARSEADPMRTLVVVREAEVWAMLDVADAIRDVIREVRAG